MSSSNTQNSDKDIGWQHGYCKDPKKKTAVTCNYCAKDFNGGIYRLKQNLVGGFRNVARCAKVPEHVKEEIVQCMVSKKSLSLKEQINVMPDLDDFDMNPEEENEVDNVVDPRVGSTSIGNKRARDGPTVGGGSRGPGGSTGSSIHSYFQPQKISASSKGKGKQQTINNAYKTKMREDACLFIARWMYDAAIPFNAVKHDSFKDVIDTIGRHGIGMKPPSYHEVRVPLLKKEVVNTNVVLQSHREEWAKTGCSIMSDGWTDRNHRSIINFLVNCTKGSMFLESVDASAYSQTGEKKFELLSRIVEKVGPSNVVQVITDNDSSYKLAGSLLEAKYPHIYWTPCAAHCIDLMLEDIGKLPSIARTIKRAIELRGYIYNRVGLVNMMRNFTNQKNLIRPAKTRFATSFLTLESIHSQKANLRKMFTSQEWTSSKWAKEQAGKRISATILMPTFWSTVVYILKVTSPLVGVLRIVDGEKKPAMGYIYEAMERAKEKIATRFDGVEDKYKEVCEIIEKRWDCQLHRSLHAAGYFLNLRFYFEKSEAIEQDEEVMSGMYSCIEKLVPHLEVQDKICDELSVYKSAEGLFAITMAKRQRMLKAPADWWSAYGSSTPNLQRFSIKVLSLTCSSSGCERNWSVFKQMRVMSNRYFGDLPYDLLLLVVKHSDLTIESEIYLAQAVLIWCEAKKAAFSNSYRGNIYHEIVKEVQLGLLPLWLILGKAQGNGNLIYKGTEGTQLGVDNLLANCQLNYPRIRLSKYLKKVDLAGCLQITSVILLLSVTICPTHGMDGTLRKKIKQSVSSLQRGILPEFPPIVSFEAVQKLDISKCLNLDLEASIELFSMAFPLLREVKAAHLLNFELYIFFILIQKCPMLCNVDLTIDLSPVIPSLVSFISTSQVHLSRPKRPFVVSDRFSVLMRSPDVVTPLANITKLTLEGRDDFDDSDLLHLSKLRLSLQYLNLNGCTSVSDTGIANILHCCRKLDSILVCYTSFGQKSVDALFSANLGNGVSLTVVCEDQNRNSLASNLRMLHLCGCKGIAEADLEKLLSQTQMLKSLSLGDTHLVDDALYKFSGPCLEMLDVSNTMISADALSYVIQSNPCLKCLNARGCKYLLQQENTTAVISSSSYPCKELWIQLGKLRMLEEILVGWGFSYSSLEALKPAAASLEAITVGLGGSLHEDSLMLLPIACPLLKSLVLHFQVLSDAIMMNMVKSLRNLETLSLCHCLGDISVSNFVTSVPNLRKLKLERVTPSMTNSDLVILTQNCRNVVDLSLLGCSLLNQDSQQIISQGWPGLVSLHLEECGEVTINGVYYLSNCQALEDLVLRHNGPGLPRNFIPDFASRMPLLRQISIDLCDAIEGDFDIPDCTDSFILRTMKIARCKSQEHKNPNFTYIGARRRSSVHKETLVLVWRNTTLVRSVVKERL